jgi:hypothetical protein
MILLGVLGLGVSLLDREEGKSPGEAATLDEGSSKTPIESEQEIAPGPDLADAEDAVDETLSSVTAEALANEVAVVETREEPAVQSLTEPVAADASRSEDDRSQPEAVNVANVKVFEQPEARKDSDLLPWVDVSPTSGTVDEGVGSANFLVTLSEPAESPIIIIFSTINDSAESDKDYKSQRGMVTFKPGVVSAEIKTPIVDDEEQEGDERFSIVLNGAPDVVNFRNRRAMAIIKDND